MLKELKKDFMLVKSIKEKFNKIKNKSVSFFVKFTSPIVILSFIYLLSKEKVGIAMLLSIILFAVFGLFFSILVTLKKRFFYLKKEFEFFNKNGYSNILNFLKEKEFISKKEVVTLINELKKASPKTQKIIKSFESDYIKYYFEDSDENLYKNCIIKNYTNNKENSNLEELKLYINEIKKIKEINLSNEDVSTISYKLLNYHLEKITEKSFFKDKNNIIDLIEKEVLSLEEQEKLATLIKAIMNKFDKKKNIKNTFKELKSQSKNDNNINIIKENKKFVLKNI